MHKLQRSIRYLRAAGLVLAFCVAWMPATSGSAGPMATSSIAAQVIRVGPTRAVKTLGEAAKVVRAGGSVLVDAGDYLGDTAVWEVPDVTLRAVNGRVRLVANGAAAEGKGIWVVRAKRLFVQGFDFVGARVPDRNGAGIRLERGSMRVRDCLFAYNEMGVLTNNDATIELDIEGSEFAHNRRPDGHNHNLYVGALRACLSAAATSTMPALATC